MSQMASIPAESTSFQASMVRALSRIAGVFVTFVPGAVAAVRVADRLHTKFVNPSQVVPIADVAGRDEAPIGRERTLSWALQLGGKQWPEMGPSSNMAETFSLLRQAVNVYNTGLQTLGIRESGYNTNQFAVGIPTAIVPGNAFASVSSRSGDLLTIKLNNLQAGMASQAQVSILAEVIVEIREGGVTLLE